MADEETMESLRAELNRVRAEARERVLAAKAEVDEVKEAAQKTEARNQVLEQSIRTLQRSTAEALENARKRVCELEYHGGQKEKKLTARITELEAMLTRREQVAVLHSAVDTIGETPMISASRFLEAEGVSGELLLKLEYFSPGFSKKDRIAKKMIEEATQSGELAPGQPVVELTSGNTGTGLAIVCAVTGHPFIAVMSEGNSKERARMMQALGAEVVLVPQCPGSTAGQVSGADLDRVREATLTIQQDRGAFRADQFEHLGNFQAHYQHTGREILRQCGGELDALVDFVGSGGTLGGCAAVLGEKLKECQCYAVEPVGAAVLAGQEVLQPNHRIQGGGYAMPELVPLGDAPLAGHLQVDDEEAMRVARQLAKTEGIFGGFSGGANAAAGLQLLREGKAKRVVALICDSGLKYLSTDLYVE